MYQHDPVLLEEVVTHLKPQPGQHAIDGTLGGGGHAAAILERTGPNGQLIGGDLDPAALTASQQRLQPFRDRLHLFETNYRDLPTLYHEQLRSLPISLVLLDLGVSSFELEDQSRGFSFLTPTAPLDMRFGKTGLTAAMILNAWPEAKLTELFRAYGEERYSRQIARAITQFRQTGSFQAVEQLTEIILAVYRHELHSSKPVPWIGGRHPATLVFQALRIAVNDELQSLEAALPKFVELLQSGGRLAVISFHSLEDILVKNFFRQSSRDCICPPEFPVCRCGHSATVRLMTRTAIKPSQSEQVRNPRSRSARLRVVEKI